VAVHIRLLLVHSSGAWVPARGRLYQLAQIIKQRDIPRREFLPPASCRPRFGRRKPPPTPLVQNRIKRCVAQLCGHLVQHAQTLRDPHSVPESPLKADSVILQQTLVLCPTNNLY
jgi:hypothetical protein